LFQQALITPEDSADEFWEMVMRQLKALAKRERQQPVRQIHRIRLLLCQQALTELPIEYSPSGNEPRATTVMGPRWPTPFAEQRTCDRGRPIVLRFGTHIVLRCDTHELVLDTLSAVVYSTLDMIRT